MCLVDYPSCLADDPHHITRPGALINLVLVWTVKHSKGECHMASNAERLVRVKCNSSMHQTIRVYIYHCLLIGIFYFSLDNIHANLPLYDLSVLLHTFLIFVHFPLLLTSDAFVPRNAQVA